MFSPLTPLFAFGFASPWLLWGLGAAAAPIIIHLLFRRKFRETQWAAMRFLLEAVRKNSRRMHVEQLLLLLLRVLILLLFAMALARPYVEQLGTYFQADQPAHKILVIDASLSMGLQLQETTLFERACEAARSIVGGATQGDAFNLLQLSELPRAAILNPAYKPADVLAVIDELKLAHGRGNVLESLRKIRDLTQLSGTPRQKEIYFITDFQRATWIVDTAEEQAEVRSLLAELDNNGSLVLVDVGQTGASNLAITEFTQLTSFVAVGEPARFRATVRNFSNDAVTSVSLSLMDGNRQLERRTLRLPAGGEVSETFSQTFMAGGEQTLHAQLQPDSLPVDDHRWLAVPVRERIRVLLVNGRSAGRSLGKATDFLALALAPGPSKSAASGLFDPVVISAGELQAQDLGRFDCVILCEVPVITPQESRLFEAFLQSGGGVIWCVGDKVQSDVYNQALYRDGSGPLPAKLGNRKGDLVKKDTVFEFDPLDYRHPIVNPFEGNPDAGLETTRTWMYLESAPNTQQGAKVALQFDTGDPAIVELPFGAGRSLLVTTTVDDTWSNWAVWPSFLPMVREMVIHAVSGRGGQRQQRVGVPLMDTLPAGTLVGDVTITRPDRETATVSINENGGTRQFSYESTDLSGMYEARLPPPASRSELFAVNVDSRESDLTKLEQDELKNELFTGLEFDYHTQWQTHGPTSTAARAPTLERGGLSRLLLYAALFLLFVEQLMAWQFRRGLALLALGLSAAWLTWSIPWSWSIHPWLSPLTVLPILALVALTWRRRTV